MGSIYLGQILADLLEGRRSCAALDTPLEPIVRGAWDAWAKAAGGQDRDQAEQPHAGPKPAGRMRGFHLRGADR